MGLLKKCLVCGNSFAPRRATAQYCTYYCRNQKNNQKQKEKSLPTKFVDERLHINRKILELNEGHIISKDYMLGAGYTFSYCTGSAIVDKKNCCAIYEFAIVPIDNSSFKIEKLAEKAA